MKLINKENQADNLTKYILERKEDIIRILQKGDNDFLFGLLMEYFDNQPVYYDMEKVIKEIHNYFVKTINDCDTDYIPHELLKYNKEICDIVRKG